MTFSFGGELLGGHNRSARPMHHDFLVSEELLGHQNPLAGLMDRDVLALGELWRALNRSLSRYFGKSVQLSLAEVKTMLLFSKSLTL